MGRARRRCTRGMRPTLRRRGEIGTTETQRAQRKAYVDVDNIVAEHFMKYRAGQRKKRLLGYVVSIALLSVFLIWLRQSPLGSRRPFPQEGCETHATFLDSDSWQVSSRSISVRTLWQKTEERPILGGFNAGGLVA
jgi:hypothetical protein